MLTAALFAVSQAHADVLPPLPEDCPDGTEASACHGGGYCYPVRCAGRAGCDDGYSCQQRDFCIGTIYCGGGWEPDATPVETVEGPCENGAPCISGSCQTVEVCVPSSGTGGSGASSTGGTAGTGGTPTGTTGTGGTGATGAGSPPSGPQTVEQGCGCRVSGPEGERTLWGWLVAIAAASALCSRRRRKPR